MRLQVVFEPSEEGGYTAYIPALPGCISEGDTLDEARRNILEAVSLYLEPTGEPVAAEGGAGRGNCGLVFRLPDGSLWLSALGCRFLAGREPAASGGTKFDREANALCRRSQRPHFRIPWNFHNIVNREMGSQYPANRKATG